MTTTPSWSSGAGYRVTDPKIRLSRKHEEDICAIFGGHQSKSSGNQWHDPADGRTSEYSGFPFAWDCKCIMPDTKGLRITRDDLTKITTQAHGRLPLFPIRMYSDYAGGVEHDWAAIRVPDLRDILELAQEARDAWD